MGNYFGFFCIEEMNVGIVERFGRFARLAQPGFNHLSMFAGERLVGTVTLRLQHLNVKCETKTKDNVFVTISLSLQYRAIAERARDAFYELVDTEEQLQAFIDDALRVYVARLDLDNVFLQKDDIANFVKGELQKAMLLFGYEIRHTLITDVDPAQAVKEAMNEINAAQRNRQVAIERVETERVMSDMRGAIQLKSKETEGAAIARQHVAELQGLMAAVSQFSSSVTGASTSDVMNMLIMSRYFETLKDISKKATAGAVFIPHGPNVIMDMQNQMGSKLLQAASSSSRDLNAAAAPAGADRDNLKVD